MYYISCCRLYDNNLMGTIESTEDTLNKVESKIKQCKDVVHKSKVKEKSKKF